MQQARNSDNTQRAALSSAVVDSSHCLALLREKGIRSHDHRNRSFCTDGYYGWRN